MIYKARGMEAATQVGGAAQEIKGKVETAVGKLKDGVRRANDNEAAREKTNAEFAHDRREVVVVGDRNAR